MFTKGFGSYVVHGDKIETESGPFEVVARITYDESASIEDTDSHQEDQKGGQWWPRWPGWEKAYDRAMDARAAYFRQEWFYCGIVLSVSVDGIEIADHAASLWGIGANYPGGDNAYLTEVANELLPEAIEVARERLARFVAAAAKDAWRGPPGEE